MGFFFALAWSQSENGVDQRFYRRWNDAAVSGDIEQLAPGLPRSVCGVPFFHWQAGTGMIAVPVRLVTQAFGRADQAIRDHGIPVRRPVLVDLLVVAARVVRSAAGVVRLCVGGRRHAAGLLQSVDFLRNGRPIPAGRAVPAILPGAARRPVSPLAIAAATALLMTIRSYLGVYAWPAMFVAVVQSARHRGRPFGGNPRQSWRPAWLLAVLPDCGGELRG